MKNALPLWKSSKVKLGLRGYFCLCSEALISLLRLNTACIPTTALYLSRPTWPPRSPNKNFSKVSKSLLGSEWRPSPEVEDLWRPDSTSDNLTSVLMFFFSLSTWHARGCRLWKTKIQTAGPWWQLALTNVSMSGVTFRAGAIFQPFLIIKPSVSDPLSAAHGPFVSFQRCRTERNVKTNKHKNCFHQDCPPAEPSCPTRSTSIYSIEPAEKLLLLL